MMNEVDIQPEAEWTRKLFEKAESLFVRDGYSGLTVEALCREAGISKRTFYAVFTGKRDFFARLILSIAARQTETWERGEDAASLSAAARLRSFLPEYVHTILMRPIFRGVFLFPETRAELGLAGHEVSLSPVVAALRRIIEYGVERCEFRPVAVDLMIWMVMTILETAVVKLPDLFRGSSAEVSLFDREIIPFILRGLIMEHADE